VAENETPATPTTGVELRYADTSKLIAGDGAAELALYGNLARAPVHFDAAIREPLRLREALAALYAIVGSDFRYQPKDRTLYLAYLRLKRETAAQPAWQAQQAYFSWLLRNDPLAFIVLDPVISVHPDRVLFEVFSKDEGTYANLSIDRAAFDAAANTQHGTTNIDFSPALFAGIEQMRSYRTTRLHVGREATKLATTVAGSAPASTIVEKRIRVPDSWLRGFLQVQSAATLPRDRFQLTPTDYYNLLRTLRMHADRKGQKRGLRIELVPTEKPRLVLEPWETVLPTSAAAFTGKAARVVRLWGRRRLMLTRRLLPYLTSVEVQLLGSGLPSFWILRAGPVTLTLGLTGFTTANWSQAVSFDLLLPRKGESPSTAEPVLQHLRKHWLATPAELTTATGLKGAALTEAIQHGCQQGRLMADLATGVVRYRPLTDEPLELSKLEFRNDRERFAHDLLSRPGAVEIVSENRIPNAGLEVVGKVFVAEDQREYRPVLLLGDEGQLLKAECTCTFFRKQGLKAGPCPHLIALRLAYAELERKRAAGADPLTLISVETRVFSRRDATGEDVVQVALERQRLKVRWGRAGAEPRLQVLKFDSVEDARSAYFARLGALTHQGYLDATAG
jgi:predicted DNA-binding WGR domain protein